MHILHINLSADGLGRYGILYGQGLASVTGVKSVSVVNDILLTTFLTRHVLRSFDHIALPVTTNLQKLKAIPTLLRYVARYRPDVIHDTAGYGCLTGLLYWPILSRFAPIVVTEHDPKPHSGMGSSWSKRLARLLVHFVADYFIVHGPECKKMLTSQEVSQDRIAVQRMGHFGFYDHGAYEQVVRSQNTILFFGTLRPNKGVDLLVPIADRVHSRFPEAKFLVVGSSVLSRELQQSSWPHELKKLLRQMNGRPYFEVHDAFIPDEEVEYFFRRAAITLLPYKDATQSAVVMIAMPFETAVVATNVGDLSELVVDGETGILCGVDVNEIANAICDLLSHPEKSQQIGEAGQQFAMSQCVWPAIARRNLRVYRRCDRSASLR